MVKLQVNGAANIVSMLPIDEKMAQKIEKNPNIVKDMLKDLRGDHQILVKSKQEQYSCFGCGVENNNVENLEERIAALKSYHASFLEMVKDLPDTDETEEEQKDNTAIDEITTLLKEVKEKAAKNGIGLTAFLDTDDDLHYFGYMSPRVFALTKMPVILAYDENHE